MGCASSTPMIATAGSEMLRSASHVAEDAAEDAKGVVQDVAHTLGQSVDAARETLGNAVTDMITNDVGSVLKEKADQLEDAKSGLMSKLDLGAGGKPWKIATTADTEAEAETTTKVGRENAPKATATATTTTTTTTTNNTNQDLQDDEDDVGNKRLDEIPTGAPTPTHDTDSLKTSTPEPEIERVLAKFMAESPPTPKPTYAELEKLTTTTLQKLAMDKKPGPPVEEQRGAGIANKHDEERVEKTTESASESNSNASEPTAVDLDARPQDAALKRPGTTEWEKYADMLSQQRKFNAADAFKLGGKFKSYADQKSTKRSTEHNHAADLPLPVDASCPTADLMRRSAIPQHVHEHGDSGLSDNNTNNNSSCHSSPHHSNHSSQENQSGLLRHHHHHHHQLPPTLNAANAKQFQREFASLIACEPSKVSQTVEKTRSQAPSRSQSRPQSRSESRSESRIASQSPVKTRSTARFSNKTSPYISRSSTMTSLYGSRKTTSKGKLQVKTKKDSLPQLPRSASGLSNQSESRARSRARSRAPSNALLNTNVPRLVGSRPVIVGVSVGVEKPRSPSRVLNTSSFLSSPRDTPFTIRKNYSEFAEQENKAAFVPDLSSSPNNRTLLNPSPSPYKIRERCSVCYNKYVI